jgi:hypothetical protein
MEPVLPNTPMRGWSILTTTENFIQQERPQCGGTLRPSMQDALAGRRSIKPLWSLTNTYSAGLFNCESDPCLQGATSVSGQPRHFDSAPRTSALLRSADIADRVRQVRKVPKRGLMRCSKSDYSITSSARSSSGSGTLRPIALAILRLITSSNFTGCSIGKSAGFAPFKTFCT